MDLQTNLYIIRSLDPGRYVMNDTCLDYQEHD